MDEEDRKQLLEAGKASLLAFQKKGKKKKKKKKDATVDSTTENITDELSLTLSENISSLEQTSLHSGNVSPIPSDHDVSQGDDQLTSGLSQVAETTDDENSMAAQASLPASNTLYLTEPVLENEKIEEPSPEFDSYKEGFYTSSPVNQLNESTDTAIKVQLSSEDKFEQVVNDSSLDRLQDQELVPEETVATSSGDQINEKEQEIVKLKEKLEVSLSSLKEVEQELLDSQFRHEEQLKLLNISHTAELEKVHEQHRMVVDKLANEMPARPPLETDITTQSQQVDRDEIEMERLKLIKESLKENYEKEKNEMKESLLKEYQEKVESYKKEMEEKANSLLEQYREQDLAAFNKQIKQKDEAAAALLQTLDAKEIEYHEKLSQLQQHINKLEERFSQVNEEKQLEVAALYKSHSDEVHSIQLGKKELESDLNQQIEQWKSKAANLEHLLKSASESVVSVDTESIEQLKADYEEKLSMAIQEKSQLESQLLSKINALNEEFSKEKQQQELSVEKKDNEIYKLRDELERVNKTLLANDTAATDASREIEEIKCQHEEALEKMQFSLTEAHQKELATIQEDHQRVSNQLQVLSSQVAELNESKLDAVSQLEKTQHQLNNLQLSLAQSNEEKQKLKDQIHNLEVNLNAAESTSAQTIANFERDTSSYKTQINQLETTISEFLSRESLLQTELQALREQNITEDDKLIPVQDKLFTELDVEILRKAEDLTSSSFTSSSELVKKLLATLESKALEVTNLQESNRILGSQMSELQETISEDKPSTTEVDLLRAYEQLQVAYEELKDSSNIELENLKHEKQKLQDVHEEELSEKDKAISSLQKQLQTVNLVSVELQNEFGREFTRYESEKQSLEQAVKEKTAAKDEFDSIVSAQTKEIEQKFEKERQALVAKLNEKETLEAELTSRKIDLEKRLTEKAKLEEVLAEKSRLEQELRVQKSELERELFEIETKLKGKENEMQQEQSDWSMKLSQKDSTIQLAREKLQQQDKLFVQKEKQLKESHDQEVHKLNATHAEQMVTLQSEMDEKNFQSLNEMEARLNKSHQEELGELKEKHSVEVSSINADNKRKIEELTAELDTRREREINDITAALNMKHEEAINSLTNQLEAKRQKELSTLKEVLERQRNEALDELRDQMSNEKQKELDACRMQCKYQYDMKLQEQRKQLEESHSLHLEAHEKGIFTDHKQLMETELLQQKQIYEIKTNQLELEHAEIIKSKIEEVQSELLSKHQAELVALQEKFKTDIAEALHQQEIALTNKHTEEINKMEAGFEAKLTLSVTDAKEKLSSQHQEDITALDLKHQSKIMSYEGTINQLKLQNKASLENVQQVHKNKEEILKSQIAELEKSASNISVASYHEELEMKLMGKDQVIQELSDASNKSRQHHEKEMNKLNTKLSSLQEEYDQVCSQMKQDHASELEGLEKKLTNQLSSRYEAKLSVLQLEAGVKEQHITDMYQQKIDALVQQHEEDSLTKDIEYQERVSSLQADHEMKLNEVELQHISELENITSEFEQEIKKRENELQDLKAQVVHVTSLNKDYLSEIESLEKQLQKIGNGKSQDLLNLEHEIELLARQNDSAIKLAETKIANKYEELLQSKTKELEDQYITKLATVQAERAIAFAQEIEQVKANLNAENDEKLSEVITAAKREQDLVLQSAQVEHKKILLELNDKWQLKQQELEERLKSEHMSSMSELESKMAEERKQQLHMLKENYEKAMKTRETTFMAEREKELREQAEYIDKLKLEFTEEKAAAIEEWNSQSSSLHAKDVDNLNNELKKQSKSVSVLQAQLEDAHQNYSTQMATMKEDFQQQIEQLKADHDQQLETVRNDKHTELVQQHMAKFKDMTDKLVQKHHSEMEQQSKSLNEGHVIEIEKLHANYQQETGLLHSLLETKEGQLKDVQTFVLRHVSSQLLEEALVMTKSLKQLVQSSGKDFGPFSQTVLLLETKLGNVAHRLNCANHCVATLDLTVQMEEDEISFSAQSLFDSQLLQIEKQKNELQNELAKCQQKIQDTEADLVEKCKEISEVKNALQQEKEFSLSQAEEMSKLKRNLQSLMAEHNVDVSKLQLTTQEHSDTTNTFTLMHKEIEQLRVDKSAAERQLASLDSFIQECLQVVTALNANVAQHLLNHLQESFINDDHQPLNPSQLQNHSAKPQDDTPTSLITSLNSKTVLMMQDSGLSSQQTTHISEATDTPKTEITEMYSTPGAPSMTIYATQDSLTDSTSSQNTYTPGELSIQNYEGVSGFQDNDSEEPIGINHIPVQSIINELQQVLESRGVSTSPLFSFSFPNASGCTSTASTFKDSLVNVQDIFLLLLQSFSSSSQEVTNYKKQLAICQAELLRANGELNQLLVEHESQCQQHENRVKLLEDQKHDCESKLQAATTEIKNLEKQIQDSHEIIPEVESLIAQSKEQPAEASLKEEVRHLTVLLEQKEAELAKYVKQLRDQHQSQGEDKMVVIPDVDDNHENIDSLVSTRATSSLADDSDQEGIDGDATDNLNIISQLKSELTSRNEQIQQLKDQLEEQIQTTTRIEESKAQVLTKNAVVSELNMQKLKETLNEKDENIRILNEGLAQLQSQHDAQQQTLSTKCSSLIDENKVLLANLDTRNDEIEELKSALQQSSDDMLQLKGELTNVLESNKSLMSSLESDKAASNSQLAETMSKLKIIQQQLTQAQEELQLKENQLQKVGNKLTSQSENFEFTKEELKQVKAKLKIAQQQLPQIQVELQLKEDQVKKFENQLASQSDNFKIAKEELEQMKATMRGMQKNIDELEAQLVEAKAKIIECTGEKDNLEVQYKSTSALHAEELATLNCQYKQQIAKLTQSYEQQISEACKHHNAEQSEVKLSNMQELARVTSEHNATLRKLEANHTKQIATLKLEHADALLKQKEDLEALHAGQMSYMKLHAAESAQEVESIEGDEESEDETDDIMTSNVSLLLKIAEIAPQVKKEIKEVRDLCKLTGQPLPTIESGYFDDKNVLLEAIKSLSDLIMQTAEATKPDAMEDWRKSLLDAVQQVLQKERDVLMSAIHLPGNDLPPEYQQLLQNQFANHAALLKELHTSDRDSLLSEIRQLRALVESLRNEQRQQLQNLFEQVKKLQQLAEAEKNTLRLEIHSLQDSKGKLSAEIDKLKKDLNTEREKAEKLLRSLGEVQKRNHELTSASASLTLDNKELHERLREATNLDVQMRQALTESEEHRATLLEQVNVLKCELDKVNSELNSALSEQESFKQELSSKNEVLSGLEHKQKAECEALIKSHQQITDANISENNKKLHATELQIRTLNASLQDNQAEKFKLETKLEQANERIEQLDRFLAQQVEESAQLQQELSAKTSALQEHDKHFKKLKKSLTQQSETIEKLQSKTTAKATQHQTVMTDMQVLLKDKEEAISQLNNIILAKEAELTKNTDILLREKVKGTELQEQLNIYKQQLEESRAREFQCISQSKSLTDQCTQATRELNDTKKKLAILEKEKIQLDLKVAEFKKKLDATSLKKSRPEQNQELTRIYKQLQSMLANELSKNAALRDALVAGDADSSDLIKMIEILLQREEIHAVTQESLQVDKDKLEKEVRQLNKQINQLQALLHTRQFGTVVKPVTTSTISDLSSQASIQHHDAEAQNAEQVLKKTLEEERLQAVLLRNQISVLEQKLAALHSNSRPTPPPIMVDVSMQTTDVNKSETKAHDAELIEIFIKYREAAERCKSLIYQKDYLVKQMNTFYQTEQAAFIMIKEMGISVDDWSPRLTIQSSSRSRTKFKVVVYVVLATIRLPLLCKRRQLRRSAVLSKRKKVIQYVVGRTQKKQIPQHKEMPSTQLPDYKPPIAISHIKKPSFTAESHSQVTLQSTDNSSEFLSLPTQDLESAVSFMPIKLTSQVTKHPNTSTTKSSKSFPDDPQVTAYLQGLEKLQARLKNM